MIANLSVSIPKQIFKEIENYPCSRPHIETKEEGLYTFCTLGYMAKIGFEPKVNDCELTLITGGNGMDFFGIQKYCNGMVQNIYDKFDDSQVQQLLTHFGITIKKGKRHHKRH